MREMEISMDFKATRNLFTIEITKRTEKRRLLRRRKSVGDSQ